MKGSSRADVRATSGEQCDVVARLDEAVAEPGDHPLSAAVASRRHVLVQRGDLGDAHQPTANRDPTRSRPAGTPPPAPPATDETTVSERKTAV